VPEIYAQLPVPLPSFLPVDFPNSLVLFLAHLRFQFIGYTLQKKSLTSDNLVVWTHSNRKLYIYKDYSLKMDCR